jgi:RNA polymerase sigma-70 factor, ECF subfamily
MFVDKEPMDRSNSNSHEIPLVGGSPHTEEFVRLFSEHQRELFKFIFLLVPSHATAEDILQETSVVLWRKFGEFRSGTDFFRWAAQVARYKVRDFRKEASRDRHRFWTDDVIESLVETRLADNEPIIQQRALLAECMRKLAATDRELIRQCFGGRFTIKAVAERFGRPVNTVYKAMNRIRKTLMECVEKARLQEGHGG